VNHTLWSRGHKFESPSSYLTLVCVKIKKKIKNKKKRKNPTSIKTNIQLWDEQWTTCSINVCVFINQRQLMCRCILTGYGEKRQTCLLNPWGLKKKSLRIETSWWSIGDTKTAFTIVSFLTWSSLICLCHFLKTNMSIECYLSCTRSLTWHTENLLFNQMQIFNITLESKYLEVCVTFIFYIT
jgi:hypothetical protein